MMAMAAQGITQGTMTVGDFVLVNAYLLQLYQPLNFFGFIYSEVRRGADRHGEHVRSAAGKA